MKDMIKKFTKRRALNGFILAESLMVLTATIMLVTYPVMQYKGQKTRDTTCISNQKQIALATAMYVQENDYTLPIVDENLWNLIDVGGKILECPFKREDKSFSYAYNQNLSDKSVTEIIIPAEIALTADSDREDSKMTEIADITLRHRGGETVGAVISFVDGHVVWLNERSVENVLFKYSP